MSGWRLPARVGGVVLCGLVGALLAACSGNEPPGTPPTSTASATPPMATATAPATQSSPATATTAAIEPPATAVITPTTEALSLDAYVAELDAAVGRLTGHYGIFVAEPDGTPIYSFGAGDQFEAASLYKLEVMVEVYRQRELGLLDFSEPIYLDELYFAETGEDEGLNSSYAGTYLTVEELLYQMIDASSNAAAWALLDRVGSENVNASMAALGLESTEIRWSPSGDPVSDGGEETVEPADAESTEEAADPESTQEEAPTDEPATEEAPSDDGAPEEVTEEPEPSGSSDDRLADYAFVDEFTPNITTAADIGWLYAQLLQGLVVSPEASAEMLALLTDQQVNDRLPAHLPEGTVVAHKTGNLDGIVHDAGVIYAPAQEVIVVVLSDEVNPDEAIEFIAWLGELTYWRFS